MSLARFTKSKSQIARERYGLGAEITDSTASAPTTSLCQFVLPTTTHVPR